MQMLIGILTNTPLWVWLLLAILVALGISRLRTHVISVWRVGTVPAVFLIWGLTSLALRASATPLVLPSWLGAFAVACGLGWLTFRAAGIDVDRRHRRLRVPGGASTLIVSLLVFVAKYVLAVSLALHPDWAATIVLLDVSVSGLSAGFFVSRLARLLGHYRQAAEVDLSG